MFDQTWQVGVANAITFETTARLRSVPGVVWTSRGAAEGTTAGACTILGEADMHTSNYDYWLCEKGAVLNFTGGGEIFAGTPGLLLVIQ